MRLATWNVNSVAMRLARLTEWLARTRPDVVCLQETKCRDDAFPRAPVEELGYTVATHGDGGRNGVAVLSLTPMADVSRGVTGDPGYGGVTEARALAATCAGVRVWSVYVPNGRDPAHDHYQYKLRWLAALREAVRADLAAAPELVVCGDFNVAPTDADVWDRSAFDGSTHVTEAERAALAELRAAGLEDVVPRPLKYDRPFTYWDYRAGMFHKNLGMRIDLVYATPALAVRVRDAFIDREMRKGTAPSDHAPVVVEID